VSATPVAVNDFRAAVEDQGFAILPGVLRPAETVAILMALADLQSDRSRAGIRHVLKHPAVRTIANDSRLLDLARSLLGQTAFPFRATLFDKSPESNWLVAWHQDTALPLREKIEVSGWGPYSTKDGIQYAHAPASALNHVLALRLHLDDSTEANGPLRVLPGTHRLGVLAGKEVERVATERQPVECHVGKGGIIAMKPLIVHASSKSRSEMPRRVLHIEYGATADFAGGLRLATA
jgi:ectoine hydroxylase-related dioxygenase (phytanoyl-CoA dioxygenase family)